MNIIKDFITPEQEQNLVDFIDSKGWSNALKRRTQHYGYIYKYGSKTLEKTEPIPDELLFDFKADMCIVNEYYNNQSISAHTDHVKLFGNEIQIISLLDDTIMKFTKGKQINLIKLPRRSKLIMKDDVRYKWKHQLTYKGERRISLTYRTVK